MNPYDLIDDYVSGELDTATAQRFETMLAGDDELRRQVNEARELTTLAASLSSHEQPSRDLWLDIEPELHSTHARPRRALWWGAGLIGAGGLAVAAVTVLAIGAVFLGKPLLDNLGGPSAEQVAAAEAKSTLASGDLPRAAQSYMDLVETTNTTDISVDIALGAAYAHLLRGEYEQADRQLEGAILSTSVKEEVAQLTLRRAVVALRMNKLDDVRRYGESSGLPQGLVFAAEVYLADADVDNALPLLKRAAKSRDERVRVTAATYLEYIEDSDSVRPQLAEATALWALGQRQEAVETADDLLTYMNPDHNERNVLLLVWAGRAVTNQLPDVAERLLEEIDYPPEGQAWRVAATKAQIDIARGDLEQGAHMFNMLAMGGAPTDGLADAIATAVFISEDEAFARELAGGIEHPAIALRLHDPTLVSAGPLRDYLERR
ncbi:MAG: anti-sigma factor RsiW [Kiritimatiellia bacterium]|jgi:anti-sigma factor RsiW